MLEIQRRIRDGRQYDYQRKMRGNYTMLKWAIKLLPRIVGDESFAGRYVEVMRSIHMVWVVPVTYYGNFDVEEMDKELQELVKNMIKESEHRLETLKDEITGEATFTPKKKETKHEHAVD